MSLLGRDDLKEQQKINELEQKIKREKEKLDKKLTHQKIVLGAFLLDMLEKNAVSGLKEYTADNLNEFLTRESDKKEFKFFIDNLKKEKDLTSSQEEYTSESEEYTSESYDRNSSQLFDDGM